MRFLFTFSIIYFFYWILFGKSENTFQSELRIYTCCKINISPQLILTQILERTIVKLIAVAK